MNEIKHLTPFRFWAQKVIPLVYDESLSYYELLCKVIDYLNKMGVDFNALLDNFTEFSDDMTEKFNNLKEWAEREFPDFVNDKLDEMAADGTLTRLIAAYLPFVTPEMFGAKGDGLTDDTEYVQAAIDSNNVVVMTGTYKVSATLSLHSNLEINGYHKGVVFKDENISPSDHFAIFSYYEDSPLENVLITGLILNGLQYWTGQTLSAINNDYGVRLENAVNISIVNNIIKEFGGCAVSVKGHSNIITDNFISYTGSFTGEEPNYNFGIEYNGYDFKIGNNSISGIIQGIISGLVNTNVIISENEITTAVNGQHALYMEGGNDVIVTANNIHDCRYCGVKFQKAEDTQVLKNIVVDGNNIKDCGAQGVLITDVSPNHTSVSDVLVINNKIENVNRGIDIIYTERAKVSDNMIMGNAETPDMYYGIRIYKSAEVTISNNAIKNTKTGASTGGICVEAAGDDTTTHDILIKNNMFNNTVGVQFTSDHSIVNCIVDGNIFLACAGQSDIAFDYAKSALSTVVCNNIFDKGTLFRNDATTIKKYFNNLGGRGRKNAITLTEELDTRATITRQDCYIKGDSVFINIDLTLLARGSLATVFKAVVPGLDLLQDYSYTFYSPDPADDFYFTVSYNSSSELKVNLGLGTANTVHHINVVI